MKINTMRNLFILMPLSLTCLVACGTDDNDSDEKYEYSSDGGPSGDAGACVRDDPAGVSCIVEYEAADCTNGNFFESAGCNEIDCGDNTSYQNCTRI
ncbi:MAG TPA: hypothetical protein DFR83_05705 [Deltaproteobacteria bacterium]|nr:hypothetical protein [Deltaproteobacteria bacterium]